MRDVRNGPAATGTAPSAAADFVARFAAYWRDPDPARLNEVLTADVTLVQPLSPAVHGLEAARAEFRRLFALVPDLRAEVDRWGATSDGVLIEFRLRGTFGRRVVEWPAVDRFTLRGELASMRVSYFDPTPLLPHLLRSPRLAWRFWVRR